MKIQEQWADAARPGNVAAIAVAAERPARTGSSLLRVLAEDTVPNHAITLLDRGAEHARGRARQTCH